MGPSRPWRDHPRSRGVYSPSEPGSASTPGSSPLARGLPGARRSLRRRLGIIPARAGFTPRPGPPPARSGDHPRSRGVYGRPPPRHPPPRGSSPLARGLRGGGPHRRPARGIIPARAGFTDPAPVDVGGREDHPRSRGVYASSQATRRAETGSSPLARGLRAEYNPVDRLRRIIPARAGFTRAPPSSRSGSGDHPRSRGVYLRGRRALVSGAGSSPLARGLPCATAPPSPKPRIIPARAGFTRGIQCNSETRRDHPRSRGVYGHGVAAGLDAEGSSPLARGLRRVP